MQAVAAAEAKFTVQNAKKITRITPVTKSAPTSVPMVNAEASKGAKRARDGNDDDELFVRTTPLPQKRKTFSAKPSQPLTSGVKPLGAQTKTISSTKAGVQPGQTISQYTISRHDWETYIKSTKKEIGFVHKPAADCKESIVEIRRELIREIHEVTGEDHPYWYCVPRAHRPPNKPFPDNPINANSMLLRAISVCVGRLQPEDPAPACSTRSARSVSPVPKASKSTASSKTARFSLPVYAKSSAGESSTVQHGLSAPAFSSNIASRRLSQSSTASTIILTPSKSTAGSRGVETSSSVLRSPVSLGRKSSSNASKDRASTVPPAAQRGPSSFIPSSSVAQPVSASQIRPGPTSTPVCSTIAPAAQFDPSSSTPSSGHPRPASQSRPASISLPATDNEATLIPGRSHSLPSPAVQATGARPLSDSDRAAALQCDLALATLNTQLEEQKQKVLEARIRQMKCQLQVNGLGEDAV